MGSYRPNVRRSEASSGCRVSKGVAGRAMLVQVPVFKTGRGTLRGGARWVRFPWPAADLLEPGSAATMTVTRAVGYSTARGVFCALCSSFFWRPAVAT